MDILMPQLGETVAEGKIVAWYKSVGDAVAAGDSLFEIETDKTSMDVPTTVAGVLSEIRVAAGATVPVGVVVAVVSGAAAAAGAAQTAGAAQAAGAATSAGTGQSRPANGADRAAAAVPSAAFDPANAVRTPARNFGPGSRRDGVKVTPVARRLAAENGVDLSRLIGSGPHGHVVARDVKAAASASGRAAAGVPGAAAGAAAPSGAVAEGSAAQVKGLFRGVPFQEVALDGMRRTVARRLLEAKQSIPHFYLSMDIAMGRLIALRKEWNAQSEGGLKLTVTDFLIKALALALQQVPEANAVWAEDCILRFQHSDLAVAVAVEDGLFTPVIRQAELKSVRVLSEEMKTLADKARNRTLKPDEYRGGSITISNLGMHGVSSFAAIVNPPQSAILAIGAVERRPMESPDGGVRFADSMSVTVSCDHRVIDGALAARLLGSFKALLEAPLRLLG